MTTWIGIGLTTDDHPGEVPTLEDVMFTLSDGRQITRELIYILVRYRLARRVPWLVPDPCADGRAYCVRTSQ